MQYLRTMLRACLAAVLVLALPLREGTSANSGVFSETPVSRNVSEGSTVEFSCATSFGATVNLLWSVSGSGLTITSSDLPGGVKRTTLSFTATAMHNNTNIVCSLGGTINGSSVFIDSSGALLLVQGLLSPVGDLTSTEVDHCTLHFTWTAPYTLQGVPILNYTIRVRATVEKQYMSSTTEFLYSPSDFGESFEVVVAAVNAVGLGAESDIMVYPPSTAASTLVPLILDKNGIRRSNNFWMYPFTISGGFICTQALNETTFLSCLDGTCVSAVNMASSPVGGNMKALVGFSLTENRKYSASVQIRYNGGVVQHSQPVEISTYDVQGIAVAAAMLLNGRVCVSVQYVQGHETPAQCFVKLMSNSTQHNITGVFGTSGCLENVPPGSYSLSATDADAVATIDTEPAVTQADIVVPLTPTTRTSETTDTTDTTETTDTTDTHSTTDPISNGFSKPMRLIPAAAAGGGTLVLLTILMCF